MALLVANSNTYIHHDLKVVQQKRCEQKQMYVRLIGVRTCAGSERSPRFGPHIVAHVAWPS